jgi:pimeloyl-ACP methyl ester carboxylesterase
MQFDQRQPVPTVALAVPGTPALHALCGGRGTEPPVLLVHGFSASSRLWVRAGWIDALEHAGRRWIVLDLRGHGHSERPYGPSAYRTNELVDDLVRVLDAAKVAQADLIGYSLGGELVLELAIAHPLRARRLVVGGIGRRRPLDAADTAALHDELVRGGTPVVESAGRRMWAAAARAPNAEPLALAAFLAGIGASGQLTGCGRLEHRVLLFAGTEDPVASGIEDLAAELRGSELIRLDGCDHSSAIFAPAAREAGVACLRDGTRLVQTP